MRKANDDRVVQPAVDGAPPGQRLVLENNAERNARFYYNETYHQEHFSELLRDDRYYDLLARFWRYSLFERLGLDIRGKVLDFGSGIGQVSAALPDTVCFDTSSFATSELRRRGRVAIEAREAIPSNAFDYLLSSHTLEHSPTPYEDLREYRAYMRPQGRIILVLPVEAPARPVLDSDWNLHLFSWSFQAITNLLRIAGWTPEYQSSFYGPFMLRTLGSIIRADWAVIGAYFVGRFRRSFPSMLTIARLAD